MAALTKLYPHPSLTSLQQSTCELWFRLVTTLQFPNLQTKLDLLIELGNCEWVLAAGKSHRLSAADDVNKS